MLAWPQTHHRTLQAPNVCNAPVHSDEDEYADSTQVRNAQLDKEASELRAENDTLLRSLESGRAAAARNESLAGAEARIAQLQAELTAAYKEKAAAAEASLQATRQLQVGGRAGCGVQKQGRAQGHVYGTDCVYQLHAPVHAFVMHMRAP